MYWAGFVVSALLFFYSIFGIVVLLKKEGVRALLKVVALMYEGVCGCSFRLFDILNYPILLSNYPFNNFYWTVMLNLIPVTLSACSNLVVAGFGFLMVMPRLSANIAK